MGLGKDRVIKVVSPSSPLPHLSPPATRPCFLPPAVIRKVAKGPQLKIKHACTKKLEQLGYPVASLEDNKKDGKGNKRKGDTGGDGEGDAEGLCSVCWSEEVEVRVMFHCCLGSLSCVVVMCFVSSCLVVCDH